MSSIHAEDGLVVRHLALNAAGIVTIRSPCSNGFHRSIDFQQ